MTLDSQLPVIAHEAAPALLEPLDIINAMIDLRAQLAELEQQVKILQPAFYAACIALNTDKIELERAIINRKTSPGKWNYSEDIVEQEALLTCLKKQFQQIHEPISGKETIWAIRLLLMTA